MNCCCAKKTDTECLEEMGSMEAVQITLPVAPRANFRSRFTPSDAKIAKALHPGEAARLVQSHIDRGIALAGVIIAGPGDPLASYEQTKQTIKLIKSHYSDITITVRTLGIGGEKYADQLAGYGVDRIELLLDGIEPQVLEKLYAWVRPGFKTLPLPQAVEILQDEQARAIRAFKDAGIHVTVVTTLYPDNNVKYVEKMARLLAKQGVDEMRIVPFTGSDSDEITLQPLDSETYNECCNLIAQHIQVDALRDPFASSETESVIGSATLKPTKERPNIGVVSSNGMSVDLHLGHAVQVLIYGPREDGLVCMLEVRSAPEPGGGKGRWKELADKLEDCFVLLAASAGQSPRDILEAQGLPVLITEESIDGQVEALYGLQKKKKKKNN